MMNSHQIQELLKISLNELRALSEVNMIVGDPIKLGEGVVIPISKVRYSFISGGSEEATNKNYINEDYPFTGGTGGVTSVTPVAFLVYYNNDIRVMHLEKSTHALETIADAFPQAVNKIINNLENNEQKKL